MQSIVDFRGAIFSASMATGIGATALAFAAGAGRIRSRCGEHAAPLHAEGQAGHLPVPVRRAVADGPVRLQAQAGRTARRGTARFDPPGAAAHRHDVAADELPDRPEQVSVRPARRAAAPGSASCCRTRPGSSTSCASSSRCTPRRSTTTRRSRSFRPGPQLAGRPSIGAWLAYGLGSENDDLPAFVVMISQGSGNAARSAAVRPPVGERLSAVAVSGREVPLGAAIRCCTSRIPPGIDAATRRRACSTTWRRSIELKLQRGRRSGNRHAHRPVRAGVSHADQRAGADRPVGEDAEDTARPLRPGRPEAGHLCRQLPARPPAGRARRAVRPALSSRLGPARDRCPSRSPANAATPISRRRP